jgi:hypothetical protein
MLANRLIKSAAPKSLFASCIMFSRNPQQVRGSEISIEKKLQSEILV